MPPIATGRMAARSPISPRFSEPVPADPWNGRLEPHPLRQPYAEPGGPAADLDWARSVLAQHGIAAAGPPAQIRSWNLSSVWRIPVGGQTAWLKVVPPFFAHEGRVLAALAGQAVPRLLGHDGGRVLLAEIPGEDMYEAALPRLLDMVSAAGRPAGLVDRPCRAVAGDRLARLARSRLWPTPSPMWSNARAASFRPTMPPLLDRFVGDLPRRFAEIAACAIPDTLVHGDFHPGNVRGSAAQARRCSTGATAASATRLLDQPAFLSRVAAEYVQRSARIGTGSG